MFYHKPFCIIILFILYYRSSFVYCFQVNFLNSTPTWKDSPTLNKMIKTKQTFRLCTLCHIRILLQRNEKKESFQIFCLIWPTILENTASEAKRATKQQRRIVYAAVEIGCGIRITIPGRPAAWPKLFPRYKSLYAISCSWTARGIPINHLCLLDS